jgi:hypothetical protein
MARKSHYLTSKEPVVPVFACVLAVFSPADLVWTPCALLLDTLSGAASTYS